MIRYLFAFYLFQITVISQAQDISLKLDNAPQNLSKVKIYLTDLCGYETVVDSCKVLKQKFVYSKRFLEPQKVRLELLWQNKKQTSISFTASLPKYIINVGEDLKPRLRLIPKNNFERQIEEITGKINRGNKIRDSIIKNVSYQNQSISSAEERVEIVRDSIDRIIDIQVYKEHYTRNLDNVSGLYALCEFAERPYNNQRIKSSPQEIELLFSRLSKSIKELPLGKKLLNKIEIAKRMSIGMLFNNISLSDTNGNAVDVLDLNKRFLLVDFWASWCIPCREQSPSLKKLYTKYAGLGFNIVAVTIDRPDSYDKWVGAIKVDGTNLWTQLSDFNELAKKKI
ncbi:TlpA family protein disulfide reductase [Pedobacter sp. GSP4]|uniref:TlpA family protein disulfide reductase n=1 Tax=Pedobacter sp. GSP4 TaxID=3453716 RepID=UPI003EECB6A6